MKPDEAVRLLIELREQLGPLSGSAESAGFTSWNHRTRSVLREALGETHDMYVSFRELSWTPNMYSQPHREDAFARVFYRTKPLASGLIDAAISELERQADSTGVVQDEEIDPELWRHVSAHIATEEWGKVASQSLIFTEDRIRRWADRPANEVGKELMTAVFGDRGDFRLGITDSEKQGWHLLAMGASMALRNVDAHRLQDRTDHKRYALGVLGVDSLLLTQLRFEHCNRFHDVSPPDVSEMVTEERVQQEESEQVS